MPTHQEAAREAMDRAASILQSMNGLSDTTEVSERAGAIHKQLDLALSVLEGADGDVSRERAHAHLLRGELLRAVAGVYQFSNRKWARGFLKSAIEAYQKSVDELGTAPRASYGMGLCYYDMGQNDAALVAMGEAHAGAEMREDHLFAAEIQQKAEEIRRNPRKSSGGCYIATACYGDYDHPDVLVLRRFRDEVLLRSLSGRAAVRTYYAVSPSIARRIGQVDWIAHTLREHVIRPLVSCLRRRGL